MTDIKLSRFARVPPGAAMDKSLTKSALRVLITLCGHANSQDLAWPSQSTIAIKAGISRQRVNAALQELCERNWIILVKKRKNRRKWSPNLYEINFDRPIDDIISSKQRHHLDDTDTVSSQVTLIGHPKGDKNTKPNQNKVDQRPQFEPKISPYLLLISALKAAGLSGSEVETILGQFTPEEYDLVCQQLAVGQSPKSVILEFLRGYPTD